MQISWPAPLLIDSACSRLIKRQYACIAKDPRILAGDKFLLNIEAGMSLHTDEAIAYRSQRLRVVGGAGGHP
jgi:hypothetical protein